LPQIDVFLENGYTKEERTEDGGRNEEDSRSADLRVTATIPRASPCSTANSESINVELEKPFELYPTSAALLGGFRWPDRSGRHGEGGS
jgi:aspartate-semialdehyde dehydrogenase